ECDFALRVGSALEVFSVRAHGATDIVPSAIKHHVVFTCAENKGRLQAALDLPGLRIGSHGDAHWVPIRLGLVRAFPVVKKPPVAALFGVANARPELPRSVSGLPHAEIHRLLFWTGQVAQVRIARDLPPIANNLRLLGCVRGLDEGETKYGE